MNIFDTLKKNLEDNGVLGTQADAIMAIAYNDESFSNLNGRWSDDADGYPPGFINILFGILRPIAYKWICENAPHAWFRPIFSPGIVGLQGKELEVYLDDYRENAPNFKLPART